MAASLVDLPLTEYSRDIPSNSAVTLVNDERQDSYVEDTWITSALDPSTADGEREQINLPRADGGKDAWLFLLGCFMLEALVWGEYLLIPSIYLPCPMDFVFKEV